MREVIAVCRSSKKSRKRVAKVLDRYFWRIGDRTWRGKATNACLDRVSRELRKTAKRNTAVVIHEIRSTRNSRIPIVMIGSRSAFSEEGLVPIASNPAEYFRRAESSDVESFARAIVGIAALFHDLGKATALFQEKLKSALDGKKTKPDAVRHELFSAAVWDDLFGETDDADFSAKLAEITSANVDASCKEVIGQLVELAGMPSSGLNYCFVSCEGSLTHMIGMLIMTHHRLPDGDTDFVTPLATRHVSTHDFPDLREKLAISIGVPFWHEQWWLDALASDAATLNKVDGILFSDIVMRASLMLADHLGSHQKVPSREYPAHLANTMKPSDKPRAVPADDLTTHVSRVYKNTQKTIGIFYRYKDGFPGLGESQLPVDIAYPRPSKDQRFAWQCTAADAARKLCEKSEGGFFGCLLAGTGTGKTRAAPTILASAAMADTCKERRYFRVSLALGLRVLATQSAQEYTADLGFCSQDVAVLVGQMPLEFSNEKSSESDTLEDGSESLIEIPDWLQIEQAIGAVPEQGDPREAEWLRSLSSDTDTSLPAICELILEAAGKRNVNGKRLLEPSVLVATIDHFMGVAAPINSRFLIQSIRIATSDLIIDEIDQFNGEDIAAIGRLIFQSGSMGRRVIIMSATLTLDVAEALHTAYKAGWSVFSQTHGLRDHVNLLVTGNSAGSCITNADNADLSDVFYKSVATIVQDLKTQHVVRTSEILSPCATWIELAEQIDAGCHRLHDINATTIELAANRAYKVSVGLVRLTRISHTAAMAAQLPSGNVHGRLRVLLCLHAQFPRMQRGWIETCLRRTLTRKGSDPDAGVRSLCLTEGLFERADAFGLSDIEIVVVASPVIETGNDLDFDWAILDPVSTRSIIQSAGRVWRHRALRSAALNVLILGRSVIAMADGKLSNPGVETTQPKETWVTTPNLEKYAERHFKELAGDFDFTHIDASPVISELGSFPLRDEEHRLRYKLIRADIDAVEAPLGRYVRRANAKLTLAIYKARKFRRSTRRTILFKMLGDDFQTATWYLDLAPYTRHSELNDAEKSGLMVGSFDGVHLFRTFVDKGWDQISNGNAITPEDVSRLMQVELPESGDSEFQCDMSYTPFTGFTRGRLEDLFCPSEGHIKINDLYFQIFLMSTFQIVVKYLLVICFS